MYKKRSAVYTELMRSIPRFLRRPILAVEANELDQVDWSTVSRGAIYLDIWGALHFELHHVGHLYGLLNTNWIDLFLRQHRLYEQLPQRMLTAARASNPADLIGARQFVYIPSDGLLLPSSVGILPWDRMVARGDEARHPDVSAVRRNAYAILFAALDDVARRLGVQVALMPTSQIDDEKMRRYGCRPYTPRTWRERFFLRLTTFPLRNQRVYVKIYS